MISGAHLSHDRKRSVEDVEERRERERCEKVCTVQCDNYRNRSAILCLSTVCVRLNIEAETCRR